MLGELPVLCAKSQDFPFHLFCIIKNRLMLYVHKYLIKIPHLLSRVQTNHSVVFDNSDVIQTKLISDFHHMIVEQAGNDLVKARICFGGIEYDPKGVA